MFDDKWHYADTTQRNDAKVIENLPAISASGHKPTDAPAGGKNQLR